METKSILESRRSWLNYGSIIAIALTAMLADDSFKEAIKDLLGAKGAVGMMIIGAFLNQYLTQTSDERPAFQMPKKKEDKEKSILDTINEPNDFYDNEEEHN